MNRNGIAQAYIQLVDAYVKNSFILIRVAEAVTDGEVISEAKTAALLRDCRSLSAKIKEVIGREPIDVASGFDLRGIHFDGENFNCPMEKARVIARETMRRPVNLMEYEMGVILWWTTRRQSRDKTEPVQKAG